MGNARNFGVDPSRGELAIRIARIAAAMSTRPLADLELDEPRNPVEGFP
jgi:hypothetical protein